MSEQPDQAVYELAMFPLGSVLFPQGVLPLHIFEPRFQQLLNHALETDRRFGVVLISRGSEVGGGDERLAVGTIAEIQEHQRFDDGRAAVVSSGEGRIEVIEWLPDDPYPRAMVRELPSDKAADVDAGLLVAARRAFDDLLDLGQRLGRLDATPKAEWETDVERASWQLAGRSPCSAHDQYQILAAPTRAERLVRIESLLRDVYTDLELLGSLEDGSSS